MRLVFALIFLLTACSRIPVTPPIPAPPPTPSPLSVLTLTPANCPQVRILLDNGTYSAYWGGAGGTVVSGNLNIQVNPKQVECRRDGVFQPF